MISLREERTTATRLCNEGPTVIVVPLITKHAATVSGVTSRTLTVHNVVENGWISQHHPSAMRTAVRGMAMIVETAPGAIGNSQIVKAPVMASGFTLFAVLGT